MLVIFCLSLLELLLFLRGEAGYSIHTAALILLTLLVCIAGGIMLAQMRKPINDMDAIVQQIISAADVHNINITFEHERNKRRLQKHMIGNLRSLFERYLDMRNEEYTNELLMRRAQFAALQSQINPHFLYNTLEALRSDAIVAGVDEIAEIAEALARFFRYSISQSDDMVPISQELQNAQNYFRIQQYRFGDRFKMKVDAQLEELSQFLMPKLMLQPIIENSILHGLDSKIGGGCVTISVTVTQCHIIIVVSDDGVGIPPDQLDALKQDIFRKEQTPSTSGKKDSPHSRMALRNVHQRIRFLFGEEYGLNITSTPMQGTDVTLFFPAMSVRNK